MGAEEARQEEGQVRDELLISSVAPRKRLLQVHGQGNDIRDLCQSLGEHVHQSLIVIVRGPNLQATNLCEALEGDIPEVGDVQETGQERVDDGGLENVAQRDPVQEAKERFESRFHQSRLVGGVEYLGAE